MLHTLTDTHVAYSPHKQDVQKTSRTSSERLTFNLSPVPTGWWNYNIFVQILYSYFRYTGRLILECTIFASHCNIIRAS